MEIGQIVRAIIEQVTDYGFWLTVDGCKVLIMLPDISWGRVERTSDFGQVGAEIEFVILRYNAHNDCYLGSIKDLHPEDNPWKEPELYSAGTTFEGRVVSLTDYGAFVQINGLAEGLLHNNEGGDSVQLHQELLVKVIYCDVENRRISLGLV